MTGRQGKTTDGPGAKRALLAWEFGAGRTHIGNLLGVGAHLVAEGVACVSTLYDPRFAPEFRALGIPVLQNYVWPARRRAPLGWTERPVKSLGDVLANYGFATPEALTSMLAHYEGLFDLARPDVVICENAHGAMLAARGRIPVIAFGTAAGLPPLAGGGFALHEGGVAPPSWPEDFVLAQINKGLAAGGRPALAELADLLRIDGVYPFGPEAFDVYAGRRTTPMLPSYVPEIERPIPLAQGDEVFVYLQGQVQDRPQIMTALQDIDRPARIYITNLRPAERAKFPASFAIERQAVPPSEILRRSRCVVHHGGPQLTAICLAAGLPQVILARELDNETSGRFVHGRGLGAAEHMVSATTEWLAHWTRRAHDDAALKQRCEAAAPEFASWFAADPTRIVADAALRLLGR